MSNKKHGNQPNSKKWKRKSSISRLDETGQLPPIDPILKCARTLFHDYRMLGHLFDDIVALEQKRVIEIERELDELKEFHVNLKMEEAAIKRTRWCDLCGLEATYISTDFRYFYCTTKCEEHLLRLIQVLPQVELDK